MLLPIRMLRRRVLPVLAALVLTGCLWLVMRAAPSPPPTPVAADRSEAAVPLKPVAEAAAHAAANQTSGIHEPGQPNYNVHVFYYAWYGSPNVDGLWLHWNHPRLPHWNAETAKQFSRDAHTPPDDIGANFYPELGPYSSANRSVIRTHFAQIRRAGIGTVVVSWYPPGKADDNGRPVDPLIPLLLDLAAEKQLRIALHIEPYADRSPVNLLQNLRYISETYARHPAFYRHRTRDGRSLPVHYIYDSYRIPRSLWRPLLTRGGGPALTIRGTPHDALILGLAMEAGDCSWMADVGFDGAYTYFATNGFTYASTRSNWPELSRSCSAVGLAFAPSVGPGYIDTSVRPWNAVNTRNREGGRYYIDSLRAALNARPTFLTVTSFNEWHEGTQIEPAAPRGGYLDYTPRRRDYYLELTADFAKVFRPTEDGALGEKN